MFGVPHSANKPLRLALSHSLKVVVAHRAWASQFKWTGQTIAVIDSGVDKNHPWLAGKVVSEACYSTTNDEGYSSICPGGPAVIESTDPGSGVPCGVPGFGGVGDCGHGTHIAGIAAGRERADPNVNFDWAGKRPDNLLPANGFSVRWSGQLSAPLNEDYTFYLISDGGAKLWMNDQLVIDRWRQPFEPRPHSAPIKLAAGVKADIRLEYYSAGREGMIHLLWGSASTPKQIIPQRYLYPEAASIKSASTGPDKLIGMLMSLGSDAGLKVIRLQISEESLVPLSKVWLALLIAGGLLALLCQSDCKQPKQTDEHSDRFRWWAGH